MAEPRTVYVFRCASNARAFNAAVPGRRADFAVLPMSLGGAGEAPPPELLRGRFPEYPAAYVNLLLGIDYLISLPKPSAIDVLNLSLGPRGGEFDPEDPLQVATCCAHDRGVPVVVAAGNGGPADGTLQVLAQAPWTIVVGACDLRGERLLDSSSRGFPDGRGPTVVSAGDPEVVYIDPARPQAGFKPGTSFANSSVSHLVVWIKKCLEIISGDIRDAQQGTWSPESRPVCLAVFGIADTGVDPRAPDPLPPEVQSLLQAGEESIGLPRDERRREWLSRWLTEVGRWGVTLTTEPSPALIERALRIMARPMPDYRPHEVGAGYVGRVEVQMFLLTLTPCRLTWLLFPEMRLAHKLSLEECLERELGPLWDAPFVQTTQTYFDFGQLLAVAKVA